jgi:GT2 family glycosyltransferase
MEQKEPSFAQRISVVLVTYNSADVLENALRSIPAGTEVIVFDNASTDNSLALAKAEGAICISSEQNLGFGKASNLSARKSSREFILFLNPDAVLKEGALEKMYDAAMRFPEAALIGPQFIDEEGSTIWRFSSILHPISGAIIPPVEPDAICCMPLLTGAALLCRRQAFDQVGGFDENIFLYHEDDDLSLRFTKSGWALVYEPAAQVYHASGCSTPKTQSIARFKAKQKMLSHAYISKKYGLDFDPAHEWRRAWKRLVIALLRFDDQRRAAALGRIDALSTLRVEMPGKLASYRHQES